MQQQQIGKKISTACGFIDRVFRLSHSRFHDDNKKMLIESLTMNDYPLKLINRLINRYHERRDITLSQNSVDISDVSHPLQDVATSHNSVQNSFVSCSLKYIPKVLQRIAKSITSVMDNVRLYARAYRALTTLAEYFRSWKTNSRFPMLPTASIVRAAQGVTLEQLAKNCIKEYINTNWMWAATVQRRVL